MQDRALIFKVQNKKGDFMAKNTYAMRFIEVCKSILRCEHELYIADSKKYAKKIFTKYFNIDKRNLCSYILYNKEVKKFLKEEKIKVDFMFFDFSKANFKN
jgi:hypothetical protein